MGLNFGESSLDPCQGSVRRQCRRVGHVKACLFWPERSSVLPFGWTRHDRLSVEENRVGNSRSDIRVLRSRATMVDDNAPNRVFMIDELARLIAGQLVLISQNSAVSLACTCRYLEEPVLSTLWETQVSFDILLEVLPEDTWYYEENWCYEHQTYDPSLVCGLDYPLEKSNA